MNWALLLLMKLRARGGWRKLVRTVKQPKGALLVGIAVALFIMAVTPSLLISRPIDVDVAASLWFLRPDVLCVVWLLVATVGRRATMITFTMPEVEFLFPGPFARRELLIYKLTLIALGPLGTALFMPLFLRWTELWWPALMLGVWCTFLFVQTSVLLFHVAIDWTGAVRFGWRVVVFALAVLAVGSWLWQSRDAVQSGRPWPDRLATVEAAWVAQAMLAPFRVFVNLANAQSGASVAAWGGVALAINSLVVGLIIWMDANFLEASLAASQRRYKWLQRARRGGGLPTIGVSGHPRLRLPVFPRLAGAGTIAWRGALELMRKSRILIIVLPGVIGIASTALFAGSQAVMASIVIGVAFVTFFATMAIPMGLRADLDHVEVFKSLPISSGAVVAGSTALAVLYPMLLQFFVVGVLSALARQWSLAATLVVCFAVPVNLLWAAADNVLILLYPSTRQFAPGDMLAAPRMMLVYMAKTLLLGLASVVPLFYALAVYLVFGERRILIGSGIWIVLIVEGIVTTGLASILFERVDPSVAIDGDS